MASGVYTEFKLGILGGNPSSQYPHPATDTFKVALYNNSHAFTADDMGYTALYEISGTGYTAGGNTLGAQPTIIDNGTTAKILPANISWSSATFTAYHAVVYDYTTLPHILVCSIDFGGAQAVSAGTFTIQWDTAGLISLT